nr:Repair protein [uncultured bacterium]
MATIFLSDSEKKELAAAISAAEENTIGEIRVYLEKHCREEPLNRALKVFRQLKMEKTQERTGVLIYVAHDDRKLAIIGDKGIHEKVPENFWDEVKSEMTSNFAEGNFLAGLKLAISRCGDHLHKNFPSRSANPNELSNEVVIGDE